MGEYIYRRTSRVSNIQLPDGEFVQAVHVVYAYKPYHSWSGEDHNKRMRRTALAAVGTADRSLERRGFDPNGFKYAVTEFEGSIQGGTILRWATNVPKLMSDYWDKHVVGVTPWPCPVCKELLRKQEEHPVCQAKEQENQRRLHEQYRREEAERRAKFEAEKRDQLSSTFAI